MFTYLIPLSVIVVIYYRIIKVLRQREAARFRDPVPSLCTRLETHANGTVAAANGTAQLGQNGIGETNVDGKDEEKKLGRRKPRSLLRNRRRRTERLSEQALAVRRRNERTTKLVMIVVLVFAVCLFPMQVILSKYIKKSIHILLIKIIKLNQ